jgi:hypothetical protein
MMPLWGSKPSKGGGSSGGGGGKSKRSRRENQNEGGAQCGISFFVVTWRDPEKPHRTRTSMFTCTLSAAHTGRCWDRNANVREGDDLS